MEFVDLLPAQQRACMVKAGTGYCRCRHTERRILSDAGAEYVVILAGDHIYKQDFYSRMLIDHVAKAPGVLWPAFLYLWKTRCFLVSWLWMKMIKSLILLKTF